MNSLQEAKELAQKVMDGDINAIEPLCLMFQPLAKNIANHLFPYDEDAHAEAMYAVVQALNLACGTGLIKDKVYISTFLRQRIRNRLLCHYKERKALIRIPRETARRKSHDGSYIINPVVVEITAQDPVDISGRLLELIKGLELGAEEEEILYLRAGGSSLEEIGNATGKSAYLVGKILREIQGKVHGLF